MLYLVKLGKINTSPNKQKLKTFITSPALQEMLKMFFKLK